VAFTQRLLERPVQLLGRELGALLEVEVHELLVDLDHLVDDRRVRRLHRREIGVAVGIEEAVHDILAAVRRQVDRQALLAEDLLDAREQPSRSTLSASILLMRIMRQRPRFPAARIMRVVFNSMPVAALITITAVSTAASAAID
jgi:hypothetical protein